MAKPCSQRCLSSWWLTQCSALVSVRWPTADYKTPRFFPQKRRVKAYPQVCMWTRIVLQFVCFCCVLFTSEVGAGNDVTAESSDSYSACFCCCLRCSSQIQHEKRKWHYSGISIHIRRTQRYTTDLVPQKLVQSANKWNITGSHFWKASWVMKSGIPVKTSDFRVQMQGMILTNCFGIKKYFSMIPTGWDLSKYWENNVFSLL